MANNLKDFKEQIKNQIFDLNYQLEVLQDHSYKLQNEFCENLKVLKFFVKSYK